MNYSDYSLHGISPFYDQTIFVRCHLCKNIVKLPQLADHLDKRHSKSNDQNEAQTNETTNNVNLAVTSNNSSSNKKGRKANDFSFDSNSKTKTQTPTKLKNNSTSTKTTKTNKSVNDLQQLINGPSNELNSTTITSNNSNDNLKLNVVEKIKNKIVSSNNNNTIKQFVISDSTNESINNNNNNNVNKSLPKLIIKKDKNAANNEVFYLNNSNSSHHQLIEPHGNCINNNSNNNQNDSKLKLNSEITSPDLVLNHSKSSLTSSAKTTSSSNTKSNKVYDPNKHCGVLIETYDPISNLLLSQEPCTRSLSCKKHSINLRRAVMGRCKSFNELFSEYKDEKNHLLPTPSNNQSAIDSNDLTNVNNNEQLQITNKTRKTNTTSTSNRKKQLSISLNEQSELVNNDNLKSIELVNPSIINSTTTKIKSSPSQLKPFITIDNSFNKPQQSINSSNNIGITNSLPSSLLLPPPPPPPLPLPSLQSTLTIPPQLNSSNLNENLIKLNLNFSNSMLAKHHPRPSAVTSFNARLTDSGGGYTLWNRKQDNLRLVLSNAFSQTGSFLDKNRCFTNSSPTSSTNSLNSFGSDQLVQNANEQNQNSYNHIQSQQQQQHLNQINSFVEVDNLINLDNHQPQIKPKVKKTKLLNDDLTNQLPTAAKLAKLNEINFHHHQMNLNDSDDLDHLDRNHLNLIDNTSANLLQHYITTNSSRQQTKSVSLSPSPSSSSSSSSSSSTMSSINLNTNGTNATNAYLLNTFN